MKYEIKNKPKSQKEIEVIIQPEEMKECTERAEKKLSENAQIKGFRPGKAPIKLIKESIGEFKFWQESCYEAVNKTYFKIIEKENLEIISNPQVEITQMVINQPLIYKATISVMPKIELPDYKKEASEINKKKKKQVATKEEVDEIIEGIKKERAKKKKVNRPAKNNDEIIINFEGSIDGVNQEDLQAKKASIVLGEKKFIQEFEKEIIGMKEGESKKFTASVPLIGEKEKKKIDFSVDLLEVFEREVPEMTDDFAKSIGDFSDKKDLENKIKENLVLEKEEKEKDRVRLEMMETIGKKTLVELPDVFVERELDEMIKDFKQRILQASGSFDLYLKNSNKTEEDLRNEWRPQAEKRIITSLVIQEISKQEKIDVTEEELEKETNDYLAKIYDEETKNQVNVDDLKLYIKDLVKNKKTFDFLESL